ncbi:uncharacterized protein CIMG_02177 [Coccidioides immitis RS]|uniref:Aminoglycoside phosphotransferase domain-containing protein n=3 Tax=Coccidioides immitis TaxID=5501 RepID=J3KKT7_COCIM|nr:uncharacterized protein CIMG_02177 [Coccidioides immitis RS]EAS36823.3 hypothetical protein CIMG_02177 [Coccidioides immitis RS]TPX25118.1 hypothetical protein DIZ76_010567 [Coccidioides immitis]
MLVKRRLLREEITYSVAKDKDVNILHQLDYWPQRNRFFRYINAHRDLVEELVSHHLGIPSSKCRAADMVDWMNGSFNLCVPVSVEGFNRVIIRFPLPYRVGERPCPGNGDEKVRCEAGAYAWLRQECSEVPIPDLYGFGLSTGQRFTHIQQLPFLRRLYHKFLHRCSSLLGFPVPTKFVPHKNNLSNTLPPYLVIEYIEKWDMLSTVWDDQDSDKTLRTNLFRGLSKIMLCLSRVSFPKIGSFVIDDNGFLCLANRPLTIMLQDLENEHIPVEMPKDRTFTSVDAYVNSLLLCHDNRLAFQPNAVNDEADCVSQMTALALMRCIRPQFFSGRLNHGPFVFALTDLHPSNILVDKEWNIRSIIDLEWAASIPLEFIGPPSWLTRQAIDCIDGDEYDERRKEFMDVFENEEKDYSASYNIRRALVMQQSWEKRTFWYTMALRSPTGMHSVFYNRLQTLYEKDHAENTEFFLITSKYWRPQARQFIASRVKDKELYDKELRGAFEEPEKC